MTRETKTMLVDAAMLAGLLILFYCAFCLGAMVTP